jgi:hypothetical protein
LQALVLSVAEVTAIVLIASLIFLLALIALAARKSRIEFSRLKKNATELPTTSWIA